MAYRQVELFKSIKNPRESPYLDWIKSGIKIYEGRLETKIQEWNLYVGKYIKFYDEEDPFSYVIVEVTSLPTFDDFGEAYDYLGEALIPGKNRNEVIHLYNSLFHYPDEIIRNNIPSRMIRENRVVAIGIEVIEMSG